MRPDSTSIPPPHRLLRRALTPVLALLAALSLPPRAAADDPAGPGESIYREKCASCHGKSGEGVENEYSRPLVGDRSVLQLARFIERSMPEDAPGTCVGEEAKQVALYIHDAFYSPIARARNRPPRIEPLRLTVRQLQNAAADLVAGFRRQARPGNGRGLRGEYFDARQPRGRPVLERIDPEVRFDFGRATPFLEGLATTGFAARWTGSLIAPDTGEYEVLIRTDHAARLWLNDDRTPLIDKWVKSGSDIEHRSSVFLLGGRAYPLKLELTSRKQGVNDKDKQKSDPKPVETLIELCWKPPMGVSEVIPGRHLGPETSSEVFVLRTPFPADDRSVGYERGSSVSSAWDEAATEAAIETAGYITRHIEELSGVRKSSSDRETKLREFLQNLVERAFRRPLDEAGRQLYVDRQISAAPDLEAAVKRVALLALKSPRFLVLELPTLPPDAYTVASRLSFALWDSIPDQKLIDAAASGRLATRAQVAAEAERMIDDPRMRSKARQFLHDWLEIEHEPDLSKDAGHFPQFGEEIASDLRTSLDLFLDDVIWGERSDFRKLLLSNELYLNGRLGPQYGFDLPAGAPFQKLSVDPTERAGVLSHPYLMARFAGTVSSSPIHRGVFLVRSVLGRALRQPPEAFAPLAPDLHPALTTRERVVLQTEPKPCQSCHEMINPLGFALEHFDALGRRRAEEGGKPIDASGSFEERSGERKSFQGVRDLAEILAASKEVHSAFVVQLFHHLGKQPILAYGAETPAELEWVFTASGFDIRELLSEIAATQALVGLPYRGKPEVLREF
ncbi:MAG TPA: DUF1592 domain-containing protein [Planctomycetota bacterium]|nr:DUF1592 domain-containing protein [Planctomycetota bacterium]